MPGGTAERQFTDRRRGNGFGRVAQNGKSSTCVVSCVDVHAASSSNGARQLDPQIVWQITLQRVERCLRPDDLVCPIGAGRLVICFGHDATHVADRALGARLASAVGRPLSVDDQQQEIDVVVGVGTGGLGGVSEVVGAALSASNALSLRVRNAPEQATPSTPRIVVAHVPLRRGHKRLQMREVLPAGSSHTSGNGWRPHVGHPQSGNGVAHAWNSDLSVLLVTLDPLSPQTLNPAIDGLLACARRIGVSPQVAASPDPEAVIESYKRSSPEVVILTLQSETLTKQSSAGGTAWEQWARITRELVRQGATVLAVSIGASVAAVATCVREGAVGLVDVGELGQKLEKLSANLTTRRLASENGSKDASRSSVNGTLPNPYHRLTYLTTSEHRVLFHMMQGASASEIAEDLIVSLATVRSHIRSILRKLRVRSQLAAVALANGAQPKLLDSD